MKLIKAFAKKKLFTASILIVALLVTFSLSTLSLASTLHMIRSYLATALPAAADEKVDYIIYSLSYVDPGFIHKVSKSIVIGKDILDFVERGYLYREVGIPTDNLRTIVAEGEGYEVNITSLKSSPIVVVNGRRITPYLIVFVPFNKSDISDLLDLKVRGNITLVVYELTSLGDKDLVLSNATIDVQGVEIRNATVILTSKRVPETLAAVLSEMVVHLPRLVVQVNVTRDSEVVFTDTFATTVPVLVVRDLETFNIIVPKIAQALGSGFVVLADAYAFDLDYNAVVNSPITFRNVIVNYDVKYEIADLTRERYGELYIPASLFTDISTLASLVMYLSLVILLLGGIVIEGNLTFFRRTAANLLARGSEPSKIIKAFRVFGALLSVAAAIVMHAVCKVTVPSTVFGLLITMPFNEYDIAIAAAFAAVTYIIYELSLIRNVKKFLLHIKPVEATRIHLEEAAEVKLSTAVKVLFAICIVGAVLELVIGLMWKHLITSEPNPAIAMLLLTSFALVSFSMFLSPVLIPYVGTLLIASNPKVTSTVSWSLSRVVAREVSSVAKALSRREAASVAKYAAVTSIVVTLVVFYAVSISIGADFSVRQWILSNGMCEYCATTGGEIDGIGKAVKELSNIENVKASVWFIRFGIETSPNNLTKIIEPEVIEGINLTDTTMISEDRVALELTFVYMPKNLSKTLVDITPLTVTPTYMDCVKALESGKAVIAIYRYAHVPKDTLASAYGKEVEVTVLGKTYRAVILNDQSYTMLLPKQYIMGAVAIVIPVDSLKDVSGVREKLVKDIGVYSIGTTIQVRLDLEYSDVREFLDTVNRVDTAFAKCDIVATVEKSVPYDLVWNNMLDAVYPILSRVFIVLLLPLAILPVTISTFAYFEHIINYIVMLRGRGLTPSKAMLLTYSLTAAPAIIASAAGIAVGLFLGYSTTLFSANVMVVTPSDIPMPLPRIVVLPSLLTYVLTVVIIAMLLPLVASVIAYSRHVAKVIRGGV